MKPLRTSRPLEAQSSVDRGFEQSTRGQGFTFSIPRTQTQGILLVTGPHEAHAVFWTPVLSGVLLVHSAP